MSGIYCIIGLLQILTEFLLSHFLLFVEYTYLFIFQYVTSLLHGSYDIILHGTDLGILFIDIMT